MPNLFPSLRSHAEAVTPLPVQFISWRVWDGSLESIIQVARARITCAAVATPAAGLADLCRRATRPVGRSEPSPCAPMMTTWPARGRH